MTSITEPPLEIFTPPTAYSSKHDFPKGSISHQQLVTLMSVSLSTAAISILAALFAFYWFIRMRRSFRHDLIMLLIQSDMMKALWLVVSPLAFFSKAPIDSNSTICQVSGFFLTASIEASDVSVLLIAIHTVLFILKPRVSSGVSGLYPYRYVAYVFWVVVPILLAAIVPITGSRYENNGSHCYLPLRPLWYRRGLSWAPRYIIFGAIIITYALLYLYVIFRYRRFGEAQRRAIYNHHRHHDSIASSSPLIADHGLLNSVRGSFVEDNNPTERHDWIRSTDSSSDSGKEAFIARRFEHVGRSSITWNSIIYDDSMESQVSQLSQPAQESPTSPSFRAVEEVLISVPEPVHGRSVSLSQQSGHSCFRWKRSMSLGSHIITSPVSNIINSIQQRGLLLPAGGGQKFLSNSAYLSREEFEYAVHRSREKMQRQLRLLFVYPAVYLLTWIAPFVSHVVRYNEEYSMGRNLAGEPPFGLLITSLVSVCIGAAVDCCFFSLWEKPWLHLRGGFWECLTLWLKMWKPKRFRGKGTGRTREERFMDARTAHVRREQENLENLENINNEAGAGGRSNSRRVKDSTPREWWDVLDVDFHDPSSERLV
ncbi:G protein-coupled glucose receptor regulating Gpa2-domain-containing protein [Hypoxylon cercidicola]|nr:G protein-coupled glucose receptor regulating Gpa2-domain-containing protein [Hypoxylon cercidicola]